MRMVVYMANKSNRNGGGDSQAIECQDWMCCEC